MGVKVRIIEDDEIPDFYEVLAEHFDNAIIEDVANILDKKYGIMLNKEKLIKVLKLYRKEISNE